MDNPADYDTDILLWSEKQARVIRAMAGRVRDLPNELDIENVAEEIESVGRSELRAAQSYLQNMFEHLVKIAMHPDESLPQRGWFEEVIRFRRQFLRAMTPAMVQRSDVDDIWESGVLDARIAVGKYGADLPKLPDRTPFPLQILLDEKFDPIAAVDTLRAEIARLNPRT